MNNFKAGQKVALTELKSIFAKDVSDDTSVSFNPTILTIITGEFEKANPNLSLVWKTPTNAEIYTISKKDVIFKKDQFGNIDTSEYEEN